MAEWVGKANNWTAAMKETYLHMKRKGERNINVERNDKTDKERI